LFWVLVEKEKARQAIRFVYRADTKMKRRGHAVKAYPRTLIEKKTLDESSGEKYGERYRSTEVVLDGDDHRRPARVTICS